MATEKKSKKEEKETQAPDHLVKYQSLASSRHPDLFKDEKNSFSKSFYKAKTKGEAKRILKRRLQELN